MTNITRPRRIIPHAEWLQVTADVYLDQRHCNWLISEELGDVLFVLEAGLVLVHRVRAPAGAPAREAQILTISPQPQSGWRHLVGWLGIVAGAAVFVAALAVPLDDPALVLALVIGVRGGRLILDVNS